MKRRLRTRYIIQKTGLLKLVDIIIKKDKLKEIKMQEESVIKTTEITFNTSEIERQFKSVHVQIQFDQQLPLKMDSCYVSFQRDKKLSITENINQPKLIEGNKMQQDKAVQSNILSDPCISIKYRIEFQDQLNEILLLIPMNSIMCIAKKSAGSTILMLKDKEKEIQRDEDGYQLVSDDEDQYEEKQNQLYQSIKAELSKDIQTITSNNQADQENSTKVKQIIIEQKCSIVMTISQTSNNQNNKSLSSQFYKYLSLKLQQYEKQASQQISNQWKINMQQLAAVDLTKLKFLNLNILPQHSSQLQDQNDQFDQVQEDDQQFDQEEMDSEEDQMS